MAIENRMKTCLISTLHDPDGKLQDSINLYYSNIQSLFNASVIKVTERTKSLIAIPHVIKEDSQPAQGRLIALEKALEITDSDLFFYLDFDRLLYWYTVFPGEFEQVIKGLTNELTVIGRTKSAFETHPELQQLTEKAANLIFSHWYDKRIDILTGCRVIPREIAKRIVKRSNPKNIAYVDAEWLIIADKPIKYFEVNGLGYEHSIFNLCKPAEIEIQTRVENLQAIMECICGADISG